jgi:hypothetical protein
MACSQDEVTFRGEILTLDGEERGEAGIADDASHRRENDAGRERTAASQLGRVLVTVNTSLIE